MADVEMTDAPKTKKAGPSTEVGEKKRFEVKKARFRCIHTVSGNANYLIVERSSALGLGYRRR